VDDINLLQADGRIRGSRIAVISSRYNGYIVDRLVASCLKTLLARGIEKRDITHVRVPGAFEIPVAAGKLADRGSDDAIITLGAIIRGETPHFDLIARACTEGIAGTALACRIPVIFGVLTVETAEQALDRSGDDESNKGHEAALAALEMISIMRQITA